MESDGALAMTVVAYKNNETKKFSIEYNSLREALGRRFGSGFGSEDSDGCTERDL